MVVVGEMQSTIEKLHLFLFLNQGLQGSDWVLIDPN